MPSYDAPDDSARARRELIVAMCQKADRTLNAETAPTVAELTDALNEVLEHAIELHRREYGVAYYTELYEDDVASPAGADRHDDAPMGLLDRTALSGKAAAVAQLIAKAGGPENFVVIDLKADGFGSFADLPGITGDSETLKADLEQAYREMQARFDEDEQENDQ